MCLTELRLNGDAALAAALNEMAQSSSFGKVDCPFRMEGHIVKMTSRLRKSALTLHVAFSVGWLGAVAAYLAMSIVGLTGGDETLSKSVFASMDLVGWWVILPCSLLALLSGFVQSFGTEWGLFRYYWILVKLVASVAAVLILISHLPAVSRMAVMARSVGWSASSFHPQREQLVVHAAGGLLVLFAITAISMFKPWGQISWGQAGNASKASPGTSATIDLSVAWLRLLPFIIVSLIILFLVSHLILGSGLHHH